MAGQGFEPRDSWKRAPLTAAGLAEAQAEEEATLSETWVPVLGRFCVPYLEAPCRELAERRGGWGGVGPEVAVPNARGIPQTPARDPKNGARIPCDVSASRDASRDSAFRPSVGFGSRAWPGPGCWHGRRWHILAGLTAGAFPRAECRLGQGSGPFEEAQGGRGRRTPGVGQTPRASVPAEPVLDARYSGTRGALPRGPRTRGSQA